MNVPISYIHHLLIISLVVSISPHSHCLLAFLPVVLDNLIHGTVRLKSDPPI
jgi:hypothetical protein